MENILHTFSKVAENESITITKLEQKIGASKGVLSRAISNNTDIQAKWLLKLVENYPQYNPEWLLTGKGDMLKTNFKIIENPSEESLKNKNLIPLFEDVETIGGTNQIANVESIRHPSEWIDAGDWFPAATAAIRHYGDSMNEYPSGCILAIKEVRDRSLIVNGQNYCIETSEYRVTKKIYDEDDHIVACSTNEAAYANGRLLHPAFNIPKTSILRMFLVLGYVVKEYSNGPILISR